MVRANYVPWLLIAHNMYAPVIYRHNRNGVESDKDARHSSAQCATNNYVGIYKMTI